jgi:hypothetical protein
MGSNTNHNHTYQWAVMRLSYIESDLATVLLVLLSVKLEGGRIHVPGTQHFFYVRREQHTSHRRTGLMGVFGEV